VNRDIMARDICCQNFKGLIAYIRHHYGEKGVSTLLEGLIDNPRYLVRDKFDPSILHAIQQDHLSDSAYWVSNDFSIALFENVKKIIKVPNPLITAGIGAVRESLSKRVLFAARFMGIAAISEQAAKINARFNNTKVVTLSERSDCSATFELKYRPGFQVTRNVCNWNLGIYLEIGRMTGAANVRAEEVRCVLDGDDHCAIKLSWDRSNWFNSVSKRIAKRMIQWTSSDLIEEYETTVRERDQLIDNLIRSEEKYRKLFEDSLDAMSLTAGGIILDVNPAWLKIHGYAHKGEVVGKDVMNIIHPEDRKVLSARRKSWPDIPDRVFRLRDLRPDSSFFDVEVYSFEIVIDGQVSLLSTIRDITELKRIEASRRQLESRIKRAEKMEALGTMAGGVAHDLNNILSGIVGYPDLILMQLPPDSPLRKPITAIMQSGQKAAAVVEDLLTLARRGVATNEILHLNHIIEEYLSSLEFEKLSSQFPKAVVETRLYPDLLNIEGSRVHLAKTVMNLVINAAEAMPDGGLITIQTENVYIDRPVEDYDAIREGDYVVLTITDTGIGISPEDKEKIFEPFYTKKVMGRSGTGLGMAVVWGTVKDLKGYINVETEKGKGTRFILYLPVTGRKELRLDPGITLENLRGNGEKILIVDDVSQQLDIASEILTQMGYAPTAVSSGEQAVAYMRDHDCDLLILDMIMEPGIDGLETYRRILEHHPDQKAVIASGFSETSRVAEVQRLGAGAYIKKPYTVEKLAGIVRSELDRNPVLFRKSKSETRNSKQRLKTQKS
jgi:PAS domain S-box-containing protein